MIQEQGSWCCRNGAIQHERYKCGSFQHSDRSDATLGTIFGIRAVDFPECLSWYRHDPEVIAAAGVGETWSQAPGIGRSSILIDNHAVLPGGDVSIGTLTDRIEKRDAAPFTPDGSVCIAFGMIGEDECEILRRRA